MKLKLNRDDTLGMCAVEGCTHEAVATADGRSFFSKVGPTHIPLCGPHLMEASDMSTNGQLVYCEGVDLEKAWDSDKAPETPEVVTKEAAPKKRRGRPKKPSDPAEEAESKVKPMISTASAELEQIRIWPITTKEDLEMASQVLAEVKDAAAQVDAERKKITGPLRQTEKAVNDHFRPLLTLLREQEALLKAKIAEAYEASRADAQAALEAAQQASEAENPEEVANGIALAETEMAKADVGGVSYRTKWNFEVIDLNKVPREYMTTNDKLINATITHSKGEAKIPGIRITEETVVVSRG